MWWKKTIFSKCPCFFTELRFLLINSELQYLVGAGTQQRLHWHSWPFSQVADLGAWCKTWEVCTSHVSHRPCIDHVWQPGLPFRALFRSLVGFRPRRRRCSWAFGSPGYCGDPLRLQRSPMDKAETWISKGFLKLRRFRAYLSNPE